MKRSVPKGFARHGVCLAVVFAFLSGIAVVSHAQAAGAAATPTAHSGQPAALGKRQPGGNHEGIQVHGYWKIDVRDPDGRVVKHVEFENSLNTQIGGPLLMALITGQNSPGAWSVGLEATPSSTLCGTVQGILVGFAPGSANSISPCVLGQAGDQYFDACTSSSGIGCAPGLSVTEPSPSLQAVTLQGQMTVVNAGTITAVSTMLMTCNPGISPATCPTTSASNSDTTIIPPLLVQEMQSDGFSFNRNYFTWGLPLTRLVLGTTTNGCGGAGQPPCQVSVQAQQIVAVTVQISFASGS